MKTRFINRADVSFSSALLICLYFILIACDIYTTWLGTPDLKLEINIIIRYFRMDFAQIIIFASITATIISLWFLKSISYINNYKNSIGNAGRITLKIIYGDRGLILSFLGIWVFTTHFLASVYLPVNNYFGYLFVSGLKNSYSDEAVAYLLFRNKVGPHFFKYVLSILVTIGFFITILKLRRRDEKILQTDERSISTP